MLLATMSVIFLLFLLSPPAFALPSFDEVKKSYQVSEAVLFDRHGEVIHELRFDPKARRLQWTGLESISPAVQKAVVHSEDKRFYGHGGVDWLALGNAATKGLFSRSARGASTITMQLASILNNDLRPKKTRRTAAQKWDQIKAAGEIEKTWTKQQILEAYLNLVTFRGELQGISAASRGLFDKAPHGLDQAEALLLAALIRSPNAPAAEVARRAVHLASGMDIKTDTADLTGLASKTLTVAYRIRRQTAMAPHVARELIGEQMISAASTLDAEIQRYAMAILRQHLSTVRAQNVTDGAVIVVENKTGNILAYVGNSGELSSASHVDGLKARRQAGSSLKPFLYGLAFEKRLITPASALSDSPLDLPTGSGIYRPENYDNNFRGLVSARTALASSLNIPAVRVIELIGPGEFIAKLKDLGIRELERPDYYGPSAALGSVDVSLLELVNAYRSLANGGVWSELSLTPRQARSEGRRTLTQETAFLVSDILSDRQARSSTFGLENSLATSFWSAVKTGTSKDMRDNWCIGYTEKYTVGVWAGNFSGRPMWNVSGVTGAAPVWLEIMNRLQRQDPGRPPVMPKNIIAQRIEFSEVTEPPRIEVFIKGTGPSAPELRTSGVRPAIIYPPQGTIIAVDPDIPDENQRVVFEAGTAASGYGWMLNGIMLGSVHERLSWRPTPGTHHLSLLDEDNRQVDAVRFDVRGGTAALQME